MDHKIDVNTPDKHASQAGCATESHISFVPIQESHVDVMREIYNHYVLTSANIFRTIPLDHDAMKAVLFPNYPKFDGYAILQAGKPVGYVILGRHRPRDCYDKTAEVSVYVSHELVGRGIGSKAIQFVESLARERGFHVMVATICGENVASRKAFEHCGFSLIGTFHEIGFKFGRYLDLVMYEKRLV